jgi:hypothetical protein
MDPYTDSKGESVRRLDTGIQCTYGVHNLDPAPDRAVGIVFVRTRIAKVDQQTITKQLGNIAVEALDDLSAGALVGADDLTQVFGVNIAALRADF